MIFTQEDYRKIEAYLKSKGIKDTEFQFSGSLTGDEEISFIQDGRNVRTTLNKFLESFRTSNFINVTEIGPSITGRYTLQEAIDVVPKPSRTEGCIITYIDSSDDDWKLYQFLGKAIEDWYDLEMWRNILSVADTHFKGSFENEDLLYEHVPRPEVGDYAFVGLKFNESVIYRCRNRWVWSPTTEKATDYIKVVIGGNITVGPNGNWFQNGVDTGIKAEGAKGDKGDSIKGDKGDTPILRLEVDEGYVQYGYDGIHWINLIPLSKFVINTNNTPDNEDIISDNHNQLKFADRKYSSANNINLGYKILRKNIQGGRNILSQDMLSDTNTIYEIRYDFDLNGSTINIPDNCVLYFKGGTFRNGTLFLRNTFIIPNSPTIEDSILASIKGAYIEGQLNYDKGLNTIKWYSGGKWSTLEGAKYGPTSERPVLNDSNNSIQLYYDTTINSLIYWNLSEWIDTNGYNPGERNSDGTLITKEVII